MAKRDPRASASALLRKAGKYPVARGTLTQAGQETLSKVVSILLGSNGYSKVVITGHGAGSVGDYFVRSGMPSSVLVVQGIDHSRGVAPPGQPLRIIVE